MRVLDNLPRIAELSLEAARQARSLAVSVIRTVAEPILGRRCDDDSTGWTRNWEPPSARPVAEPPPPPSAPRRPRATTPAAPSVAPDPGPEPAHIDRDTAVVVVESADRGAEDGAGAEVTVAEPWDGYDAMKAKDVTEHLATADRATLAIVRLYESTHRRRRTVLAEVDRRLATAGG